MTEPLKSVFEQQTAPPAGQKPESPVSAARSTIREVYGRDGYGRDVSCWVPVGGKLKPHP